MSRFWHSRWQARPRRWDRPAVSRKIAPAKAPGSTYATVGSGIGIGLILLSACGATESLPSTLSSATAASAASAAGLDAPHVALPPLAPLAGDRLQYRFCDHAGEAVLDLRDPTVVDRSERAPDRASESAAKTPTSLRDRFLAFDSPYKMVSPYSGLRGDLALRVIEVAVAEPTVEKYPRPAETQTATGESAPRFDPVWNRYRGVYESKVALFAPAPSCYRYRVALPKRPLLTWHYAAIPPQRGSDARALPSEFSVRVDGQTLWSAQVGKGKPGGNPANGNPANGNPPNANPPHANPPNANPPNGSPSMGPPGHWLSARVELPASAQAGGAGASAQHEVAFCTVAVRPDASKPDAAKPSSDGASAAENKSEPSAPVLGSAVWGSPELWSQDEGAAGPNVLLVLIDTLRADAMSAMPRLSQHAQQGVAFSQAITAATWTRPSLLGLLGGELATAVGQSAEEMIPTDRERKRFYALDRRLLPRALRDAGYKVASIGNNFFLLGYPQIGLSLGFDEVADVRHPVEDTPAISRAAIAFLQEQAARGRSFFLQLHYDAPHWPYTPPAEHLKGITDAQVAQIMGLPEGERQNARLDSMARAYLGEAAYADAQLGRVLDELDRLGLRERTLVIVVGDHGEIFDPKHNHYVPSLKQPTLYHHGWSAYDEILRVPLVLSMPKRLPQGTTVAAQVRLTDVAPTVLELLGLGTWRAILPSGLRGDGQSLLPLIFPSSVARKGGPRGKTTTGSPPGLERFEDEDQGRPAYAEGQNIRALRHAGFLYLRRGDARLQKAQGNDGVGPMLRVAEELYDLTTDPFQHTDLLAPFAANAKGRDATSSKGGSTPAGSDPMADPRLAPILARLRDEFARHTPQTPEQGLPLVHLMLAPDARASHLLTGTLVSSDAGLAVQGVRNGEVVPRGPGRIDIKLRPGGVVDVLVDPSARIELVLSRDGLSLASRELLLGPFSLPLLPTVPGPSEAKPSTAGDATPVPIVLEGPLLDRLSSTYAPVPGERGEVLLWRDQTAPGVAAASTSTAQTPGKAGSASEVETLMRDWGYARPASAPTSPSPTPAPAPASPTSRPSDGGL